MVEIVLGACDVGGTGGGLVAFSSSPTIEYVRKVKFYNRFALVLLTQILKTGKYDLWSIRMEQYLTFTDHALWEVIVNGVLVSSVASASAEGLIPPKTAELKLARKNELKAKSTLMLAILDEHLLNFHACKDAKSLGEAIKNRFRGNKESKKMQKTILKQNYENFAA
nr:ribonuclease H-like domain-containing protein [Tanacetum cinerariifolium]